MARTPIAPPPTRFGGGGHAAFRLQPKMPAATPPPPPRFGIPVRPPSPGLRQKRSAPVAPPPVSPIRGTAVPLQPKRAGVVQPASSSSSGFNGGYYVDPHGWQYIQDAYGNWYPIYPSFQATPSHAPASGGAGGASASTPSTPSSGSSVWSSFPITDRMDVAIETRKKDLKTLPGWETWRTAEYKGLNIKYWMELDGEQCEVHVKWDNRKQTEEPKSVTVKPRSGKQLKELTPGSDLYKHLLTEGRGVMTSPARNAPATATPTVTATTPTTPTLPITTTVALTGAPTTSTGSTPPTL